MGDKRREERCAAGFLERFRHHVEVQIRFNDVDHLGHVNNSVYQQFFDLGRLRYFEAALNARTVWTGGVVVLAHLEIDFYRSMELSDRVAVGTRVSGFGNRSFRMEQAIYGVDNRQLFACSESVMVGYHTGRHGSAEIPAQWRTAIKRFEGLSE